MTPRHRRLTTGRAFLHIQSGVLTCSLALSPAAVAASELNVTIEIPQLNVAEYHRPYLAVWLERSDQTVAANLAVWYEIKRGETGTRWLTDLRQWWRRGGRDQQFPIDGVTGATRPIGLHLLSFNADKAPLAGLAEGNYALVIEVVREAGGREALRIPVEWPARVVARVTANGKAELGAVVLTLNP